MAGIAGIAAPSKQNTVRKMLNSLSHRGHDSQIVTTNERLTIGMTFQKAQALSGLRLFNTGVATDAAGSEHFARVCWKNGDIKLERGLLGVKPLYIGKTNDGLTVFASEVKTLLPITSSITPVVPGILREGYIKGRQRYVNPGKLMRENAEQIAKRLHVLIEQAVKQRINGNIAGSWLSGGLDSSAVAAIASKYVGKLYTFAAGMEGSSDLQYARIAADGIGSIHKEIVVNLEEILKVLPDVIFHLESFDALLVRSSITNYLAGKVASDYVDETFSGEGADELFAGYEHLKEYSPAQLPDLLFNLTASLHNTALQRVDRCSTAHGITAYVPLLDPTVVEYSMQIPAEMKIKDGIEKWIFRKSMESLLPQSIIYRKKAKFWQGSGMNDLLSKYADSHITDGDFAMEQMLPNGWRLNSKEELMYYRIFKQHFGELQNLEWMGRTQVKPQDRVPLSS